MKKTPWLLVLINKYFNLAVFIYFVLILSFVGRKTCLFHNIIADLLSKCSWEN